MSPTRSGEDAAAVLVVRAWRDADRFRARATSVLDVEHGSPRELVTASTHELEQFVHAWLSDVRTEGASGTTTRPSR